MSTASAGDRAFTGLTDVVAWPSFLPSLADLSFLQHIYAGELGTEFSPTDIGLSTQLFVDEPVSFAIPGIDAVCVGIASYDGGTLIPLSVQVYPQFAVRIDNVPVTLDLKADLFKPVRTVPGASQGDLPTYEADPTTDHVSITLGEISLQVDGDGNISVTGNVDITIPPMMIGDSGVVIEAQDIGIYLDANNPPPGKPAGWRGVHIGKAAVHLPGGLSGTIGTLQMADCYIGNGGFSGTVSDTWTPPLSATIAGMACTVQSAQVTFVQNALTAAAIGGSLTLPFFDEPLGVEIGFNLTGNLTVALSDPSGMLTLTKPGLLSIAVNGLGFDLAGGVFSVHVSGDVTPLFGDLNWPTFQLKDLAIDSHGNVHLDGGWLDLPNQYSLDFHGFGIEITKIGFGRTDDGGKWIGFSGGISLADGLSAGASVKGLRIAWYDDGRGPAITLDGVGVEFEIPEVLRFKGAVDYHSPSAGVHQFDGSLTLDLIALGLEIDGTIVVGSAAGYTYFAIYLDCELPAGIPLWATGLGLYGMAGLFALNMKPSRASSQDWYDIGSTADWFHSPKVGVTDLATKWVNSDGAMAAGAGITLGTEADDGYTLSGKMLLVISFPGPVILIQGAASILKERASLDDDPLFRALVVLDFNSGSFLIGLDMEYKYDDSAALIDVHGGCEAFFSTSDPSAWFLDLGLKDPPDKRIRAQIFKLFEADAYFMLSQHQLAMGARVGYGKSWSFGPLSVAVQASIDGNVVLSRKPVHLSGDLALHGNAALSVFGFSLTLAVDATVTAEVFRPFDVKAEFSVAISLPWPLPSFSADITLEFGPDPTPPPLPVILKEIAVEHFKVTTTWPLPRTTTPALLVPDYDAGGFYDPYPPDASLATAALAAPPPSNAPVVPLDARPRITFGRAVHDLAPVGVNAQPVLPDTERIGDPSLNQGPTQVRYSLAEVDLDAYDGSGWTLVARAGSTPNPPGVAQLYGSWAPLPSMPDGNGANPGQVKLWLWSKTPFDFAASSSSSWNDWFTSAFAGYPCSPAPPDRQYCCDFSSLPADATPTSPIVFASGITIEWLETSAASVIALAPPVDGLHHALCLRAGKDASMASVAIVAPQPCQHIRIALTPARDTSRRRCVLLAQKDGTGPNPLRYGPLLLTALGFGGNMEPHILYQDGIAFDATLTVRLNVRATFVSVLISVAMFAAVEAFNADGSSAGMQQAGAGPHTLAFENTAIVSVTISNIGLVPESPASAPLSVLHEVCYSYGPPAPDIQAAAEDVNGNTFGPFRPVGNVIDIPGDQLIGAEVTGRGGLCLVKACCTVAESQAQAAARQEMMQHLRDELALWSQTGTVLTPNTQYRITVVTKVETSDNSIGPDSLVTELAYFATQGPPGLASLSTPVNAKAPGTFSSGLEDLTAYVRQTVPATVPAPGQRPPLPKPVYRGYDVGAAFNEDYVDLMYRISERDLGLYLYDHNNQPVRDATGALIALENRWGHADSLSLSQSDTLWINVVNTSACAVLDTSVIPHDVTLGASGVVLSADSVYQARLIPLLLHEAFTEYAAGAAANGPSGTIGRWQVADEGTVDGPSNWVIQQSGTPVIAYVVQNSGIRGGTADAGDPVKPGTLLLYGDDSGLPASDHQQPGNWTDYRLSMIVRSPSDGALGAVVRYADEKTCYRFSLDRAGGYRRLVRVVSGTTTVLAQDDFVYRQNQDYQITIEAVGSALAVYQDGAAVFTVTDSTIPRGRIGLYCWSDAGARFQDIRVDDFGATAPVTYQFSFTTSGFTDVFHHLHSFQDETWLAAIPAAADISAQAAQAVSPPSSPSPPQDAEVRAYAELAATVAGQQAFANPAELQVSRIEQRGVPLALLVRGPEPIDWARTTMTLSHSGRTAPPGAVPLGAKLTDVTFGTSMPNEESVTVLLRDALDMTGHRIEQRTLPGPLQLAAGDPTMMSDDFSGPAAGRLYTETFGPNALDSYTVVDEGTSLAPSQWSVTGGAITQSSGIYGGTLDSGPDKPGSVAVTGSPSWGNIRIRATLASTTGSAIGLVFRYRDDQNYYRFSMDQVYLYRRLTKTVAGTTTTLWEDGGTFNLSQSYDVDIIASADRLIGYLDGVLLFSISDRDLPAGLAGFYVWKDPGASFSAFTVESADAQPLLWQPPFTDLSAMTIVDAAGLVNGPSRWAVAGGALLQTANVYVPDQTALQPGTCAVGGNSSWRDVMISVRMLTTTGGAMGVLVRYTDDNNYYRLAIDSAAGLARLIKRVAGNVTVLWSQPFAVSAGTAYDVTVLAQGSTLTGWLAGGKIFSLSDADLLAGSAGFYARANPGVSFSRVTVIDPDLHIGAWTVHDQATATARSLWKRVSRALEQRSPIGDAGAGSPGTTATAGSTAWTDYRFVTRLRSDRGQAIGVVFRYADENNYYRFSMDSAGSWRRLVKNTNGTVTTLWEDNVAYTVGEDMVVTIDAIGSRLAGFLGDQQIFDVTDATNPAGLVGLYSWTDDRASFGHVSVSQPPLGAYAVLADAFAAGDMTAWTVSDEGTLQGPSDWHVADGQLVQDSPIHDPPDPLALQGTQAAAGDPAWTDIIADLMLQCDDGSAIGVMIRYQDAAHYYRFSMDSVRGYRRLVKNAGGQFTLLWQDTAGYTPGTAYRLTIQAIGAELRGYIDGVLTFVADDQEIPTGQIALYTWDTTSARFWHVRVYPAALGYADWLLDDGFQAMVSQRWSFSDTGKAGGPSAWAVDPAAGLEQTSSIDGTYAIAGASSWADYRYATRLTSATGQAIGVVFRRADARNFYRFTLSRAGGYRRLEASVSGVLTTLWQDAVLMETGREYVVTVDCVGDRLTVYIDGVPIVALTDGSVASGAVGLYASGNPGAVYREVRVAPLSWSSYFVFGAESAQQPGTKYQVFSGNESSAPAPIDNVSYRFVATLLDAGLTHFGADAVDLRLVDPRNAVVHGRRFFAAPSYDPLSATLLRSADGTSFAICVPAPSAAGTQLSPGQHRISITYRRDNTAAVPTSQVLSENGSTQPEVVTLDIPWVTTSS